MRFLVDESVEAELARELGDLGHDVARVGIDLPRGTADEPILKFALQHSRIVITNDSDFGELVMRRRLDHSGVIFLRLRRMSIEQKIDILRRIIHDHVDELDRFLVVTPSDVRVR